jgi:predicted ATPase
MKISIKGIKSLKDYSKEIEINKMTVITGKNSSGKSSFTLGLKLLSENLKQGSYKRLLDLMELNFNPKVLGKTISLSDISNKNDLQYRIELLDEPNLSIEFIYKIENDIFQLTSLICYHKNLPLIIKRRNQKKHKMDETFSIQVLAGNIEKQYFEIIHLGIEIYKNLSSDKQFNAICDEFENTSEVKLHQHTNMEFIIEALEIENKYMSYFESKIGRELLLIIAKHIKNKNTSKIKYLLKNGLINHEYINSIEKKEVSNLIKKLNFIYITKDINPLFSFTANSINSETEAIQHDMNSRIASLKDDYELSDAVKEYLIKNENAKETDYNDIMESYSHNHFMTEIGKMSPNLAISSIINDWIDKIFINTLNDIADFKFDDNLLREQKMYFLENENNELYDIANYFYPIQGDIENFNKLITKIGIGKKIIFEKQLYGAGYMIFIENLKNIKVNYGTLGSGHYLLLRLLLITFYKVYKRHDHYRDKFKKTFIEEDALEFPITLLLNEPEIHLHPSLQTSLCNLLVLLVNKFKINFIIETHSEYLIRALQLEIKKENIKNNECNLYYFENHPESDTQIKQIRIDQSGLLIDQFGTGFLDESQKMMEELFKTKLN